VPEHDRTWSTGQRRPGQLDAAGCCEPWLGLFTAAIGDAAELVDITAAAGVETDAQLVTENCGIWQCSSS